MRRVLLIGPPGSGKIMVARHLHAALPPPDAQTALETAWIHYGSGLTGGGQVLARPFRAPHYTVSAAGLVGVRTPRRICAGEVSLAHGGTLVLDGVVEFQRLALEELRVVLREGANRRIALPARPALVVACALPCDCGYWDPTSTRCICDASALLRYQDRLFGVCSLLGITEMKTVSGGVIVGDEVQSQ